MQSDLPTIREQLLSDFIPDDVCPLGGQLLMDTARLDSKDNKSLKEVVTFRSFQFFLLILGTHNSLLLCRFVHVVP